MDCQGAEKQRFPQHEWSRPEGDVRKVVGDTIALSRWLAGGGPHLARNHILLPYPRYSIQRSSVERDVMTSWPMARFFRTQASRQNILLILNCPYLINLVFPIPLIYFSYKAYRESERMTRCDSWNKDRRNPWTVVWIMLGQPISRHLRWLAVPNTAVWFPPNDVENGFLFSYSSGKGKESRHYLIIACQLV